MKIMDHFRSHTKVRDTVLFAVFSLFLFGAFILWAKFDATRQEIKRNMEVALRQCGAMIQNGERDDLSLIINHLLESNTFKRRGGGFTWQAYDMSKSFRESMLPESAIMRKTSGNVLLTGFLIWCVFFVAWLMLPLLRVRSNWQLNYLKIAISISAFFLLAALIGSGSDMGYRTTGIQFDLENLRRALALPEFPPTMLEELQNPQMHIAPYGYLSYKFEHEK